MTFFEFIYQINVNVIKMITVRVSKIYSRGSNDGASIDQTI